MEASAAHRADERVAAVRDDPARRLMLAAEFYDQRNVGKSIRPYRRAEIAFMRWQIKRGVLFPSHGERQGSPWWRAVNESLLRDAVEADLLFNGVSGIASTAAVRYWIDFLQHPGPASWYRAHNASIVAGYLANRSLVALETPLERFFMDVALLRVLYAHSLLVRPRLALGRLAAIGRFLGDPRRRAADLFLSIQNVLPDRYPLDGITIDAVLARENYLGRLFDYGVIVPRLELLYRYAADDLSEPGCQSCAATAARSTPGRTSTGTSGAPSGRGAGSHWSARSSGIRSLPSIGESGVNLATERARSAPCGTMPRVIPLEAVAAAFAQWVMPDLPLYGNDHKRGDLAP